MVRIIHVYAFHDSHPCQPVSFFLDWMKSIFESVIIRFPQASNKDSVEKGPLWFGTATV